MGRKVCILDTSVLCELVQVPHLCHDFASVTREMAEKVRRGESLLLPMTAILETGNHVGQNGNGHERRRTAQRFVKIVETAIRGEAPFVPIQSFELEALLDWLAQFPDWVLRDDAKGKGSGLGDLTVVKEWERQCSLNPHSRVFIWSLDHHLASYDRE